MDDAQTLRSMVRDDSYRVVKVLADGPSGKTELVTFDGEGPLVRKHIPSALANASAWAAAMEIDEPLLPRIESLYRMPDELVVVYEYVPGTPLDELVRQSGHLGAVHATSIVRDVCRAVSALHARGVVHRDITPGNVIVADDGAHLVDLGIARQRAEGRRRDTTTLGTWGFAAPEQFGFAQTDARSDVYSLGCLLGHLLTGAQPGTDAYESALEDRGLVSQNLEEVVRRATAFEPSARYQSAKELSDALDVRAGVPVSPHVPAGVSSAAAANTYARQNTRRVYTASPIPGEEGWQGEPVRAKTETARQSTSQEGRSLSEVPIPLLVLAVCTWGLFILFAALVVLTTYDAITIHKPKWDLAEYAMSVISCVVLAVLGREIYQAITWSGPYARRTGRLRLLLSHTCIIATITFILLLVVAALLPH